MERPSMMAAALKSGRPGDVAANTQSVLSRIRDARAGGAELLVLPEMCLSGVTAGDFLGHPLLLDACLKAADDIAREAQGLAVVMGLPIGVKGRAYNAAALAYGGRLQGLVIKNNLNWQERRVFSPAIESPLADEWPWPIYEGERGRFDVPGFGALQVGFADDLKAEPVAKTLAMLGAFPSRAGGGAQRLGRISALAGDSLCAWANAGANESSTDQVYDGQAIILEGGRLLAVTAPFSGDCALPDEGALNAPNMRTPWEPDPAMPYAPLDLEARAAWCREALEIAAQGLAIRLSRIGAKGVSLGLSGGIDSAMALLASLRAFEIIGLSKEKLFAVSLPAFGTSRRTRDNSRALMRACGLAEREIDITSSVSSHLRDIRHPEGRHDAAFENAQARERTQTLMGLANQQGGLMVGPGDMSELALGFTTFGGDHMSMYGVNGGLYKTAIRLIVAQYASDTDNPALCRALGAILNTPISPELLPGEAGAIRQKTEAILGPYLLNDFFLHRFLMDRLEPGGMLEEALLAFGPRFSKNEIIDRMRGFFSRFFASQFKRSCMPDGPQVLGLSLSPRGGLNMPSDASAALWLSALDGLSLH
ncbi:MAG: NAD(+) synthase [Eubacteriales bacterium]|jgi:NAD+ synthase (glutamine-hydrolysing)|nr:NAD(+) synthase [Eubacteriales bacterium]MDD3109120.1 NAD(+) synthase [Eubacteriales bacterium]MDD3571372.1 NAD(+) synthase [Eubacteriales bacterium]MDD4133525.1 NAD(+) synthase [Eubacteriales bacterium]